VFPLDKVNSVLTALLDLSSSDLKKVITTSEHLLSIKGPTASSDSGYADFTSALVKTITHRLGTGEGEIYHALKSCQTESRAAYQSCRAYSDRYFEPPTLTRAQRMQVFGVMFLTTYDYLTKIELPVKPKVVLNILKTPSQVFEDSFPGYAKSGLLKTFLLPQIIKAK